MDTTIVVMIVTLAMPNGQQSVSVKPMRDAATCRQEAGIEASDPYVTGVACSALKGGVLQLNFGPADDKSHKTPQAAVDRSAG